MHFPRQDGRQFIDDPKIAAAVAETQLQFARGDSIITLEEILQEESESISTAFEISSPKGVTPELTAGKTIKAR